ncbi:MAG: Ribonuclease VapC [Hydrocarboniphaga sp.]|nr:Ribonuclease VapC [Hydrocarboniphaga sp.]
MHEFISVVTHARIFKQPTPLALALDIVAGFCRQTQLQLLAEDEGYLEQLKSVATTARVQGPMIHDARIAALCLHHGITELWSADRDFSRFPRLKVVNPLLV